MPTDTNGWDVAFALRDVHVNTALSAAWESLPASIKSASESDSGYSCSVTFSPWTVAPGTDAAKLALTLPFATGTLTTATGTLALAGGYCVVEVDLRWVPQLGQATFGVTEKPCCVATELDKKIIDSTLRTAFGAAKVTLPADALVTVMTEKKSWGIHGTGASFALLYSDAVSAPAIEVYEIGSTWPTQLRTLQSDPGAPVTVAAYGVSGLTGLDGPALQMLLAKWFQQNLRLFAVVLATADLAEALDQSAGMAWMRPTDVAYAVQEMDTSNPTVTNTMLGTLWMTQSRPAPVASLSPFAITVGADAAVLVSGPRFVEQMLLAGAMQIFRGSTVSDFEITNDDLNVQNVKRLPWSVFEMPNGSTATVAVDPGQFTLAFDTTEIRLSLTNISIPYSEDLNTAVSYTEVATLCLQPRGDGTSALWMNSKPTSFNVSCTKTQGAISRDIALGAVSGAFALLGLVGAGASAVSAVIEASSTAVTVASDGAVAVEVGEEAIEAGNAAGNAAESTAATAASALSLLQTGKTAFLAALRSPMFIAVTTVAATEGLAAVGFSLADAIEQLRAGNWTGLPAFDTFAANLVRPVQFAALPELTLTSATLNGALVLSFVMKAPQALTLVDGAPVHASLWSEAQKRTAGRGDGRLGVKDAYALFELVARDSAYSDLERKTLARIRRVFHWTKAGDKTFRRLIRAWAARRRHT